MLFLFHFYQNVFLVTRTEIVSVPEREFIIEEDERVEIGLVEDRTMIWKINND